MSAEQYMEGAGITKLHVQAVVASKEAAQRERDIALREVQRLRKALQALAKTGPDSYWRDFATDALNRSEAGKR